MEGHEQNRRRRLRKPNAPQLSPLDEEIVDAQTVGAANVPDKTENAPRNWINPALLTDSWEDEELAEVDELQRAGEQGLRDQLAQANTESADKTISPSEDEIPSIDQYLDELDEAPPNLWEDPIVLPDINNLEELLIDEEEELPIEIGAPGGSSNSTTNPVKEDDLVDERPKELAPVKEPKQIEAVPVTIKTDSSSGEKADNEETSDDIHDKAVLVENPDYADSDEKKKIIALGGQGIFQGPTTLSLISSNLTQEVDELDDVFSAMGKIEAGQAAWVRVCFREDPEFSTEAANYVKALKYGQDPNPPEVKPYQKILGIFGFIFKHILYYLTKGGQYERPRPTRAGVEEVRPVKSIDQTPEMKAMIREMENKSISRAHYDVTLYSGVAGYEEDEVVLEAILRDMHSGFDNYATPFQRLAFEPIDPWLSVSGYVDPERAGTLVLSAEELGELARIPDDITRPIGVQVKRAMVKPMMPRLMIPVSDPLNPPPGIIPFCIIGEGGEEETIVGMRNEEINQHLFIVGRTGTGKSVLMQWLMYGVAKSGYPIVFMDPHGDSAEEVLNMLAAYCPERLDDIVFIDFGDKDWPVQLNPLDIQNAEELEDTIHSVMEMLKFQMKLDGTGAPRAHNYANQAISALTEANLHLTNPELKCTLLQVTTFFTDKKFRQLIVSLSNNPAIKEAYDPEDGPFENLTDKQKVEHAMPILRAFQPLGNSPSFANVFASPTNRLDFARLINDKKIVLLKLAKHGSQKALASFVGSLIIPYMLQSKDAWGRVLNEETNKREGSGVRLFVDEAPSLIGDAESSVMTVLAESRKWDFGLIAATQYPRQLDPTVEAAFYANTASKVSLSLAQSAVRGIANEIDGGEDRISSQDIIKLPPYWGYMNLLMRDEHGLRPPQPSGPFSGLFLMPLEDMMKKRGLPNPKLTKEHKEKVKRIKEQSRALVCQEAAVVNELRHGYAKRLKEALGQIIQDRIQNDVSLGKAGEEWSGGWSDDDDQAGWSDSSWSKDSDISEVWEDEEDGDEDSGPIDPNSFPWEE